MKGIAGDGLGGFWWMPNGVEEFGYCADTVMRGLKRVLFLFLVKLDENHVSGCVAFRLG